MLGDLTSFDQIKALAESNPEALEKMRQQEVEKLIRSAPAHMQNRLRGLQFQIDCKRDMQKSPMGACIEISRMMHDSLNRMNAILNGKATQQDDVKDSKVLSFPAAG